MEEDLFEALENKSAPVPPENHKISFGDNKEKLWDKNDFEPLPIDKSKLVKIKKSFTIAYAKDSDDVPEEKKEIMVKLAKGLIKKGYVFRHNGDTKDGIQNILLSTENVITESYIPWRRYNPDIVKPITKYPELMAYRIAASYHSKFNSMPPAVRAINANFVHSLLGKSCINPSTLLLCYSETGDVVIDKNTKYDKCRNLTFPLRVTEAADIPVFNVAREDCVDKCIEFVKAID